MNGETRERRSSYILQILQVYNEEKYKREIEGRTESIREMTERYPSVFLRYLEYDWSGDDRDFQAELMVKMQYGSSMEQRASEKRLTLSDVLQIGIRCAEAMDACRECRIPVWLLPWPRLILPSIRWPRFRVRYSVYGTMYPAQSWQTSLPAMWRLRENKPLRA